MANESTTTADPGSLHPVVRALPGVTERVETGAVQFGDDWPGVFIRGDHAGYWALMLRSLLVGEISLDDATMKCVLANLQGTLAGCVVGPSAEMLSLKRPNIVLADKK